MVAGKRLKKGKIKGEDLIKRGVTTDTDGGNR